MGWTYVSRHGEKVKDILKRELSYGSHNPEAGVLDIAIVNFKQAYAAVRIPDGNVVAAVVLLDYAPHDVHDLGFKIMSEAEGPNEFAAPQRILDKLSPINHCYKGNGAEWATKWRRKARARLAMREGMKLEVGDRIIFNGKLWELVEGGRRKRFARVFDGEVPANPPLFKLVNWKKHGKRA